MESHTVPLAVIVPLQFLHRSAPVVFPHDGHPKFTHSRMTYFPL